MELSYWKMAITDYVVCVSEEEAKKAVMQYERGDKVLKFFDMFGSETYVPAKDFNGVWYTSLEIRQASEEFNAALKEEERENKKTWD